MEIVSVSLGPQRQINERMPGQLFQHGPEIRPRWGIVSATSVRVQEPVMRVWCVASRLLQVGGQRLELFGAV